MNGKIIRSLLLVYFFLSCADILMADTSSLSIKEEAVVLLKGDFRMVRFYSGPDASGYYALGYVDDEATKNYSLFHIEAYRINTITSLSIPLDNIANPYIFKDNVRIFELIDYRYLYIGVRHLEGNVYIAIVDTHDSNKVISSFTIDSSGFSDIFVDNNGKIRVIGTNEKPFVTVIDREQEALNIRKKLGGKYPGEISAAALLSDGKIIIASNRVVADVVKSSVYLLDKNEELQKEAEVGGVAFNILSSSANTAIVMRSLDEEGGGAEAIVYDAELKEVSRFALPSLAMLLNPVNQASAVGKSDLMITEVGSREGNMKFIDVIRMRAGEEQKVITLLENTHKDNEAVYDTIISRQGKEIRIGVTVMQEENNAIKRTFTIYKVK